MAAALNRVGAAAAMAEALLERRTPAVARRLSPRERRVEAAAAALFAAAACALALSADTSGYDALDALLLGLFYALLRRVRFQLGPGLIRPTQLVFVPMLFLVPPVAVPLLVGAASVLGELPDVLRRRAHAERLYVTVADSWYSIGPAIVIGALGGGGPVSEAAVGVLVLALAAQFAGDLAASVPREWFGAGIAPAELLPVMGLVYLIDLLLSPIGYLAVLASEVHGYAYLLALAPGALLGMIARERSARIDHELELERAFRRSTRALDARAVDLQRQAGRLQRPAWRVSEPTRDPEDRAALERMLLATTVEALRADGGRLSQPGRATLEIGDVAPLRAELDAAEEALGTASDHALAVAVGSRRLLAVGRLSGSFSAVERDLLEHLAAQAAVTLENLRLEELMRRTEAELRAILEGVADAVAAEDASGRLVFVNAAAERLLDGAPHLGARLGIPSERLPGRQVLAGRSPEALVVRHAGRWSRVKAASVLEDGEARLAISVIEDITEIKQAEEAQQLLAESSRVLAGSLELEQTLPALARLVSGRVADACVIHLLEEGELVEHARAGAPVGLERLPLDDVASGGETWVAPGAVVVPIRVREGVAGTIALLGGVPDRAVAEDLGVRAGAAVDNARLYRTRAAIAQTLQRSLLPPELPDIPGMQAAGRYQPIGEGNEVGGDFYDVFSTGEREWFAVIGDVCGKGAEAAAVTALARYTIRAGVLRNRAPSDLLRMLNTVMRRQRARRFVTIACARVELGEDGTAVATVCCGGHPSPRVLRADGRVETIGEPGTLLGVVDEVELFDRVARLAPGDALVLYTDGLTEVGAPAVWTPAQLDAAVASALGSDADGIVDHLVERAAAGRSGLPRDDLALLALRVQPLL